MDYVIAVSDMETDVCEEFALNFIHIILRVRRKLYDLLVKGGN